MEWLYYYRYVVSEMSQQSKNAPFAMRWRRRSRLEAKNSAQVNCTATRYGELLPLLIDQMTDEDLLRRGRHGIFFPFWTSATACGRRRDCVQELLGAVLAMMRRASGGLRRPVAWWKKRSGTIHLTWCA